MNSILLIGALAADPALPPPTVRDTVYIERTVVERVISPQSIASAEQTEKNAAKWVIGGLLFAVGTYMAIDASNNPDYKFIYGPDGMRAERQTNPILYLGVGTAAVGFLTIVL